MVSDIAMFFEPLSSSLRELNSVGCISSRVNGFFEGESFPEIEKGSVVLFGVIENRRSNDPNGDGVGLENVRRELYKLQNHFEGLAIVDLGNISSGETVNDTYYAVTNAIVSIIKEGGIAVILGGSQDITYANYLAYERLEQVVNLVTIDARFDLGEAEDELHAERFLQKIILHQPNILFNYSNLAFQTYHVMEKHVELLRKMYFDVYRLGNVQSDMEEVEPVVRNADLLSVDLNAVRSSDLPSNIVSEPNGLYGEQLCAIARYAGLSDKLTSFGVYNTDAVCLDPRSAKLVSQMLWYFLWGVQKRKKDYPFADKSEYTKYTVTLGDGKYDIVFYKSSRSDRWWMEVPYPSQRGKKYERHFMVPCTYGDYVRACEDEIPDRWWQTFQKLG